MTRLNKTIILISTSLLLISCKSLVNPIVEQYNCESASCNLTLKDVDFDSSLLGTNTISSGEYTLSQLSDGRYNLDLKCRSGFVVSPSIQNKSGRGSLSNENQGGYYQYTVKDSSVFTHDSILFKGTSKNYATIESKDNNTFSAGTNFYSISASNNSIGLICATSQEWNDTL